MPSPPSRMPKAVLLILGVLRAACDMLMYPQVVTLSPTPQPRFGASLVATSTDLAARSLVLLGNSNDAFVYNQESNTWEAHRTPLPTAFGGCAHLVSPGARFQEFEICYGGVDLGSNNFSGATSSIHSDLSVNPLQSSTHVADFGYTVVGSQAFLVTGGVIDDGSGKGPQVTPYGQWFDVTALAWSSAAPYPQALWGIMCFSLGKRVICCGGVRQNAQDETETVAQCYGTVYPETSTSRFWVAIPSMPGPMASGCCATLNLQNTSCCGAGTSNYPEGTGAIYCYDWDLGRWYTLPATLSPRKYSACASTIEPGTLTETIHFVGGQFRNGTISHGLSTHEAIQPAPPCVFDPPVRTDTGISCSPQGYSVLPGFDKLVAGKPFSVVFANSTADSEASLLVMLSNTFDCLQPTPGSVPVKARYVSEQNYFVAEFTVRFPRSEAFVCVLWAQSPYLAMAPAPPYSLPYLVFGTATESDTPSLTPFGPTDTPTLSTHTDTLTLTPQATLSATQTVTLTSPPTATLTGSVSTQESLTQSDTPTQTTTPLPVPHTETQTPTGTPTDVPQPAIPQPVVIRYVSLPAAPVVGQQFRLVFSTDSSGVNLQTGGWVRVVCSASCESATTMPVVVAREADATEAGQEAIAFTAALKTCDYPLVCFRPSPSATFTAANPKGKALQLVAKDSTTATTGGAAAVAVIAGGIAGAIPSAVDVQLLALLGELDCAPRSLRSLSVATSWLFAPFGNVPISQDPNFNNTIGSVACVAIIQLLMLICPRIAAHLCSSKPTTVAKAADIEGEDTEAEVAESEVASDSQPLFLSRAVSDAQGNASTLVSLFLSQLTPPRPLLIAAAFLFQGAVAGGVKVAIGNVYLPGIGHTAVILLGIACLCVYPLAYLTYVVRFHRMLWLSLRSRGCPPPVAFVHYPPLPIKLLRRVFAASYWRDSGCQGFVSRYGPLFAEFRRGMQWMELVAPIRTVASAVIISSGYAGCQTRLGIVVGILLLHCGLLLWTRPYREPTVTWLRALVISMLCYAAASGIIVSLEPYLAGVLRIASVLLAIDGLWSVTRLVVHVRRLSSIRRLDALTSAVAILQVE